MVEAVTGIPFDSYLKENVFDKAKMKLTCHMETDTMPHKDAQPYRWISSQKVIKLNQHLGTKAGGGGGWISTPRDLYAFMNQLVTSRLISPGSFQRMQTGYANDSLKLTDQSPFVYGMERWNKSVIPDRVIYGHNGGGAGFNVDTFYELESGYIIASCTNMWQNSRFIVANFFKAALNQPVEPVRKNPAILVMDFIEQNGLETVVKNPKNLFEHIQMKEPYAGLFAEISNVYNVLKQPENAITWSKVAVNYHPENPWVWTILGDALRAGKREEEAKSAYQKALQCAEKSNNSYWINAAKTKLSEG